MLKLENIVVYCDDFVSIAKVFKNSKSNIVYHELHTPDLSFSKFSQP